MRALLILVVSITIIIREMYVNYIYAGEMQILKRIEQYTL